MLRGFVVFLSCLLLAAPVTAGPWLREKGKTFTSVSIVVNYFYDTASSTYLEYGLRDDMTVGADVGIFRDTTVGPSGSATLFLRRALSKTDGKSLWAYELGVGANWQSIEISPHLKTALTWGRGMTFRERNGWLTVDASINWALADVPDVAKLDGTLGMNVTDRFAGMFQVYVSHSDGATSTTLAPSIIYTPKNGKSKWQIGLESPLGNTDRTAIKFGLWREF